MNFNVWHSHTQTTAFCILESTVGLGWANDAAKQKCDTTFVWQLDSNVPKTRKLSSKKRAWYAHCLVQTTRCTGLARHWPVCPNFSVALVRKTGQRPTRVQHFGSPMPHSWKTTPTKNKEPFWIIYYTWHWMFEILILNFLYKVKIWSQL